MSFKTSVNIKFDIGNNEFIKRYIATPSHAEAFKGISEGFINKDSNKAHIIIGPYGTGKSLLANIMGSIVAGLVSEEEIQSISRKFDKVDEGTAENFKNLSKINRQYLPVLLSGNEGRFRQSILSGIIKSLEDQGINITLPGITSKIIDTITVWENDFPETYNLFCTKLNLDNKDVNKWLSQISKQNEQEIRYFSDLYPKLTSGANFDINYDYSFMSQLEFLSGILQQNNFGVFIVYDEFARFLQSLTASKFNETMQDIQDLAELTNRSEFLHILLITHKGLRQYFNNFSEEIASEFQRIEKRFKQYFVKSDQATFLRIAEIIVSENIEKRTTISESTFEHTQKELKKYTLFPSLNQTERDELITQGMYPLHPISLFMLPQLTSVFGQNERTLFTFLESQDSGGLINHITKSNSYYLPHQLFDYFFTDFNDIRSGDTSEQFIFFKKAIARIPSELESKELAIHITKFISLWNICNLQSEQALSNDFLAFALNTHYYEIENMMKILVEHKILRFNRVNNYWEVFSGSFIDLEERLKKEKQTAILNEQSKFNILYKNLMKKYYLPQRYNDEKGMTRFAAIEIVEANHFLEENMSLRNKNSDFIIYYVLQDNESSLADIESKALKISEDHKNIVFIHSDPYKVIDDYVKDVYFLDQLSKDKNLISEDKGLLEEIKILINESNFLISDYLNEINKFSEESIWYINAQKNKFSSEVSLSEWLSTQCDNRFRYTPVILNDSFNRAIVSGQQKNAAIKLINLMLKNPYQSQFEIEGSGPEYSMYASILKNNGRLDLNINNLNYENIEYEPYSILRNRLIELLDTQTSGSLQDIIDLFTSNEFGIRKPVVPVLLVALLRDRWNEFMLFSNEMFVPGLSGDKLFTIINEIGADKYDYKYDRIDNDLIEFFGKIEVSFSEYLEDRLRGQSRTLFTAGTLMKWVRGLPRLTQVSNSIAEDFKWFRDCIKRSEINPQESMYLIFEKYQNNFEKIISFKAYGENYIGLVREQIQKDIFELLELQKIIDIENWLSNYSESSNQNKLVRSLNYVVKNNLGEDWTNNFIKEYVGAKLEDWSDITYNLLITQLQQDHKKLEETYNDLDQKNDGIIIKVGDHTKFINKVELSVKSKVVYDNVERMINSSGKNISRQELEYLMYKLFDKFVNEVG